MFFLLCLPKNTVLYEPFPYSLFPSYKEEDNPFDKFPGRTRNAGQTDSQKSGHGFPADSLPLPESVFCCKTVLTLKVRGYKDAAVLLILLLPVPAPLHSLHTLRKYLPPCSVLPSNHEKPVEH